MQIASILTEAIASAADCVLVLWFMTAYFGEKKKIRLWEYGFWFLILFLPSHFMTEMFNLQCVLVMAGIYLFSHFLLKGREIEKVIINLILCILMGFINIGVIQLVALLSKSEMEDLIVGGSILRIIVLCVSKATLVVALIIVERCLDKKRFFKREEYIFGGILYLAFFVVSMIALRVIVHVDLSFRDQMNFLVLTLLLMIINSVMFWMIRRMNEQNRCRLENGILRVQLDQQEKLICNTQHLYQDTRKIRHDMKHYFTTYLQLLKDGDVELVMEDMQKMLDTQLDAKNYFYIEDKMLGAVINQKASVCREEGIPFEVQITGKNQWANESNIAILLSNLLDNAIEAERKQEQKREIILKIFSYKEDINILVENYIEKSVLKENPNLRTTKGDRSIHGIGMGSVREIVRQEEGTMDIFEKENRFVIHILIPEKQEESVELD